jgi:predicted CopG family antitoxin
MNKIKINITIDEEIYNWLNKQRGMVPLSTFINYMLSERKEAEEFIVNYEKDSGSIKTFIQTVLAKVKGGDRILEILSNDYLKDFQD